MSWQKEIDELRRREALARRMGGEEKVARHHNQGKLRIIGVTSTKRSAALPDIPAVAELPGFAGYNFTNWTGVFVAARTPPALIERLASEIAKAVKDPGVREKLLKAGVEPLGLSTPQFAEFLKREHNTYLKIAGARNIRVD